MAFTITVADGSGKTAYEIRGGGTVRDALAEAGVYLGAPCGGRGRCGKCRVTATGALAPAGESERALLGEAALSGGVRLACLARLQGPAEITLPRGRAMAVEPARAPETPMEGPPAAAAEEGGLRYLGRRIESGRRHGRLLGMAADIGTTTLAVRFFDLAENRLLGEGGGLNPQVGFGADIITRIAACSEQPGALVRMQNLLLGALNTMAGDFCRTLGCAPQDIAACVLSGNTAMLHIAAGLDPAPLARAPFAPASLFGDERPARRVGLAFLPEAPVYFTPCVSAFVGGDITAGLLARGLDRAAETTLFLDLGTNGEMALCRGERILCCSTAAGPVFEGAHIEDGAGSVTGAVSGVTWGAGGPTLSTIGGASPIGICGTGLIDAVACMLALGIIDETGRFAENTPAAAAKRITKGKNPKFILDSATGIGVTQRDIREVQLAKAAVAAGIATLLNEAGLTAGDIERIVVAGGLGTRISPASACAVGLLPAGLEGRVLPAGNTSLQGASLALLSASSRQRLAALSHRCEYLELSGSPVFGERYLAGMGFGPEEA